MYVVSILGGHGPMKLEQIFYSIVTRNYYASIVYFQLK